MWLILTLTGAVLIRIPLSWLQLAPSLILSEVATQFKQIHLPKSTLHRLLNCQETVEPSVSVASFEVNRVKNSEIKFGSCSFLFSESHAAFGRATSRAEIKSRGSQ